MFKDLLLGWLCISVAAIISRGARRMWVLFEKYIFMFIFALGLAHSTYVVWLMYNTLT